MPARQRDTGSPAGPRGAVSSLERLDGKHVELRVMMSSAELEGRPVFSSQSRSCE